MNALELTEQLRARMDSSERDARGIVYAISCAVESITSKLVTTKQFNARMAELRQDIAAQKSELRIEIAALRVELHQAIRSQTIWLATTMIGTAGVIVAAIKLIP